MESRSNNPDGKIPQSASSESLNNKDHNGSSSPPSSSRQDRSTVPMNDNRSAAEKWESELERMKQAASEQEAKLAESKALLNDRLVRVAQEEAFAAEMEAKRLEELRLKKRGGNSYKKSWWKKKMKRFKRN